MENMRILIIVALSVSLFAADPPKPKTPEPPTHVTITIGQLIQIGQSGVLLMKLAHQDFPALTAFRLSRLIAIVQPEIQRAFDARSKLFTAENSTSAPDNPANKTVKPEFQDQVKKELDVLAAGKIDLPVSPLSPEEDLPGAKLSAQDILDLGPLLKEPLK